MGDSSRKKDAVVIVPIYRTDINDLEKISLAQCLRTLSGHPIVVIKPRHLDLAALPGSDRFAGVVSFDDGYFTGVQGYNRLMMSPEFYEEFLGYEFMLIHQLDVFVFRDELLDWCGRGYDYIGAPWLKNFPSVGRLTAARHGMRAGLHRWFDIHRRGLPSDRQLENVVGNGGFSLRRVEKFAALAREFRARAERYNARTEGQFNEDVFWSVEVNRRGARLKRPGHVEALSFAFENFTARSLSLTGGKLPFGCHDWHRRLDFWRPFIEAEGYELP